MERTLTYHDLQTGMAELGYMASDDLAVSIHLALTLGRPLLLEGAAGVGKTEVARVLAEMHDTELVRLQCYEGLDAAQAIYEWNYQKQLLSIRAWAEEGTTGQAAEERIFSRDYLLERPLLAAITKEKAPILLIDEVDRADEEFEAYLLEILSEFQITIPELGTIKAQHPPTVILTCNGTRDLSDALRRRCLYTYVNYPDPQMELAILNARHADLNEHLAKQIIGFVQKLREEELEKVPGIAEMLDFAAALSGLGIADLSEDPKQVQRALITLLKNQSDQASITAEVTQRIAGKAA